VGRVADLFRETRYEQAADLLDSSAAQGPQANWWRARLATDPARFQELALGVAQDGAIGQQLARDVTVARAREHFAAGRYQSAEGLLRPLAESREPVDAAARLWWGMSLQASGEARAATRALESVPEKAAEYAFAQALLADLNLRAQRPRRAREHAEASLSAGKEAGAIALGVLEQLARAEGDPDRSAAVRGRLADDYPRSVELTWARAAIPAVDVTGADADVVQAVEADGPRRSFALQYGAFRDRALALRRIRQLEDAVSDLRLEVDREESPPLYRVVGGSFGTRAQAERARDHLATRGIDAFILAPER
jgi:cell division protein FtsN